MAYNSKEFSALSQEAGFPFYLKEKQNWLMTSGIGGNLDNSVNHYWNLANIRTSFRVKTNKKPASYITGYAYNSNLVPAVDQLVWADFEVINSVDGTEYPPYHRSAYEITGDNQVQNVASESLLIQESGNSHSSCFFSKDPYDFTVPITIQPENTGAFVITSDSGVAGYFENLTEFGDKKEFNVSYQLDMGSGVTPMTEDTRIRDNNKWYIVPAADWDFTVTTGKMVASYYQYNTDEIGGAGVQRTLKSSDWGSPVS